MDEVQKKSQGEPGAEKKRKSGRTSPKEGRSNVRVGTMRQNA